MEKNRIIFSTYGKNFYNPNFIDKEHIEFPLQDERLSCSGEFICSLLNKKIENRLLSLQFFSEEDDDGEDIDGTDTSTDSTDGTDVSTDSGVEQSNPVIAAARKKAQNMYNKSGARDKINQAGERVGDKTKGLAHQAGDAVGGRVGSGISKAGDFAGKII